MTQLIFVRHGESEANRAQTFAGWTNARLTERGYAQAERTAEFLKNYPITAAYASDLSRAYETACRIALPHGITVEKDPAFREVYAGKWEGLTYEDIRRDYWGDYEVWLNRIGLAHCTGGESFAELAERVRGGIVRILERHQGESVLIGTHATPIRTMECVIRGVSFANANEIPWRANASVTIVEVENGKAEFTLVGYNEHQGELKTEPINA